MSRIYDDNTLMEQVGIKDGYLKCLRDNGLLGCSRYGDKYWYTQADVDRFLSLSAITLRSVNCNCLRDGAGY